MINVPNLDTALDWAARIPAAPGSVIEVRPSCWSTAEVQDARRERFDGLNFAIVKNSNMTGL